MLVEWQLQFNNLSESDSFQLEKRIKPEEAFGCLCLLLTKSFPNKRINTVMQNLLNEYLDEKIKFLFVLDTSDSAELHLSEEKDDYTVSLPVNFAQQLRNDYLSEMQKMVRLASLIKDKYPERPPDDRQDFKLRATALEADFLISFQKLVLSEGLEVIFTPAKEEIIERFPNGIGSLPQALRGGFPFSSDYDWASYFKEENKQN